MVSISTDGSHYSCSLVFTQFNFELFLLILAASGKWPCQCRKDLGQKIKRHCSSPFMRWSAGESSLCDRVQVTSSEGLSQACQLAMLILHSIAPFSISDSHFTVVKICRRY